MNRAHAQPGGLRKRVAQTAGPGTTLIPQSSPNLWVTINTSVSRGRPTPNQERVPPRCVVSVRFRYSSLVAPLLLELTFATCLPSPTSVGFM